MSAHIIPLETPPLRAHESLIKTLEELIVLAKDGEITGIAAAVIYADGHTGSWASGTIGAAKRIGAVTMLLHELCVEHAGESNVVYGSRPDEPA